MLVAVATRNEQQRDVGGDSSPKTILGVFKTPEQKLPMQKHGALGGAQPPPGNLLDQLLGALVAMEPRRSIPNSAVKHCKGDNTPWVTGREDSLVPRRSK